MFLNGGARTSATPPRAWFSYKEHTPPHRGLGGWVVAVVAGWRVGWLVGWLAGLAGLARLARLGSLVSTHKEKIWTILKSYIYMEYIRNI